MIHNRTAQRILRLVLQTVARLDVLGGLGDREAQGDVAVFLMDAEGRTVGLFYVVVSGFSRTSL